MRDARSARWGGVAIASAIGLLAVLAGAAPAAAAERTVLGELYSAEW